MRNEISAQERRKHSARIDRALSTSRQATSGHAADDQLKVSDQRVPLVKVAVTARPPRHRQRTDRIEPEVAWQRCTHKKNNPAAFPYALFMPWFMLRLTFALQAFIHAKNSESALLRAAVVIDVVILALVLVLVVVLRLAICRRPCRRLDMTWPHCPLPFLLCLGRSIAELHAQRRMHHEAQVQFETARCTGLCEAALAVCTATVVHLNVSSMTGATPQVCDSNRYTIVKVQWNFKLEK